MLEEVASADHLETLALEWMASPEPEHRVLAVEVAGRAGTRQCMRETVGALQDPDAIVRRAAAAQLGGQPEALPALLGRLRDDPHPSVRLEAARALRTSDTDSALLALIGALHDPAPTVRRVATETLVSRRSLGLAHRVAAELTTANAASVGEALLGMGAPGEEALTAVLGEAGKDRAAVAAELLRRTDVAATLVDRLQALDPDTRLRAVDALGILGGPQAVDGLATALCDSSPGIRSRACFHLGQLGDGRSRRALQVVSESDPVAYVVRAAKHALRLIDARALDANGSTNGHAGDWESQPEVVPR